jgi:hypothetical protein
MVPSVTPWRDQATATARGNGHRESVAAPLPATLFMAQNVPLIEGGNRLAATAVSALGHAGASRASSYCAIAARSTA